jgi:signal transduction histidine kinase
MATLDGEDIELDVSEAHTELGRSVCVTISRSSAEPDSDPDELFDPFRALERSNGDLGPAISRRIIDNQGGRVDAQMDGEVFRMRIIFPITVIDTIAAPEE